MHQTGCTHRSSETAAVWRNTFTSLGTQMRHAACRNAATVSRKHAASSFRTVRLSITYVFSAFACVFCIHVLFFCFRTCLCICMFFQYSRFLCIRTFFLYSRFRIHDFYVFAHFFCIRMRLCIHVFYAFTCFSVFARFLCIHSLCIRTFSVFKGFFFKYSHLFCIHVFSVFTFSLYSSF